MGFATNSLALPGLLGARCLALSDEKNHASLILGLRLARATVRVFRHNDVRHLERLARQAVAERKWDKIFVVSIMNSSLPTLQRELYLMESKLSVTCNNNNILSLIIIYFLALETRLVSSVIISIQRKDTYGRHPPQVANSLQGFQVFKPPKYGADTAIA